MSRTVRIGGTCLNQVPMDWKGNAARIVAAIEDARQNRVEILCLPELCITGYGCEDMFLSQWLCETAFEKLESLLPHCQDIIVSIGLPMRVGSKIYNAIAIVENGRVQRFYAKHNLANDGVHYEPRWFSSWPYEKVIEFEKGGIMAPFGAITLELKGVKTGFEICEDAWQEDRPACNLVKENVELILNPSASHFAFDKEKFREELVRSSSEKFNCTYLYTNLLGNESGRMIYDGDVLIAQKGKLVGHNRRFSFKDHNLLYADVDFDNNTTQSTIHDDPSSKLEEFSHALPLALFDYLRKSKSQGFVLSLSGGADSSTIAVMVAQMVRLGVAELGIKAFCGKINLQEVVHSEKEIVARLLTTAYQGTINSSEETKASAKNLAQSLGATHHEWTIDDQVESATRKVEEALGRKLTWEQDDIALQNIQARSRSPIIWMLANIKNSLLLTTSNRSEGDVGYATMDGDTSGSLSPIAAVNKDFILRWLKCAENELGYEGLKSVNQLTPTAELRPLDKAQTDEKDLMPYSVMAKIERLAIKERHSPKEVFDKLKADYDPQDLKTWIKKFFRLWAINQWKRERIAPAIHLDDFNVDPRTWCRFPILSAGFAEELDIL